MTELSRVATARLRGRGSMLFALVGPAFALLYAGVCLTAIRLAEIAARTSWGGHVPGDDVVGQTASHTWTWSWRFALAVAVTGAVVSGSGLLALRRRVRRGAVILATALHVLYIPVLLLVWEGTMAIPTNDTTGFSKSLPWWYRPAAAAVLLAVVPVQLAFLVRLARQRRRVRTRS
ncbi:hypothetical protein ABT294_35080 [Nonomuraea sp. NPDC000554]|uniref:hypothetical protein n=1 Tax=Nonomuraea sp. NPDC000554 TaxID=3154259 RepID=UPI003326AD70